MATRSAWLDGVRERLLERERFSFVPDRVVAPAPGTVTAGEGPRVAFCGFPSDYSLAFLLALLELEVRPVAIITSPRAHPAVAGPNVLSAVADHIGVPLLRLDRVNDDGARARLAALRLDGVVMASFDQIIRGPALALAAHGWMNIHPSLLPSYRGPEPVYWAIAEGAATTGITLHRAVPLVDAGPALAQREVAIEADDDAGTLTRRLCCAGAEALPGAVARLLGDAAGEPLDVAAGSYRPSVGHRRLATAPDAPAAARMVRAGWPSMPAYVESGGEVRFVARAEVVAASGCAPDDLVLPGGCLRILESAPTCSCADGGPDCPRLER